MDNDASAEYEQEKYFNAGRAAERKRCTYITNLMARLATDNSEAAHVALKAQVACVISPATSGRNSHDQNPIRQNP